MTVTKHKILLISIIFSLIIAGCQREMINTEENILPATFTIEIPQSISFDDEAKEDTIDGSRIYSHMRKFIYVGQMSANLVNNIINKIRQYGLNGETSFSYTGQDGDIKTVYIRSNATYQGRKWQYKMSIYDAQSDTPDNGLAMTVFWNNDPVEGIAIVKPDLANKSWSNRWKGATYKVWFSENPENTKGYDQIMVIWISHLPADSTNRFSLRNLKMFVGRDGSRIDVKGNSDHPYGWLLIPRSKPGLEWAFVASADVNSDIGVAQVGLPPNYINTDDRNEILGTYSLYKVLYNEFSKWYLMHFNRMPSQEIMESYLANARSPGFFDSQGFVRAGDAPSDRYNALKQAIDTLTPYNPANVANLYIDFEQ